MFIICSAEFQKFVKAPDARNVFHALFPATSRANRVRRWRLRVGGIALLVRDAKGAWARRDERDLNRELSKLYGLPLDVGRKRGGLDAVAAGLGTAISRARRSPHCCCNFRTLPYRRVRSTARWKNGVSPTTLALAGF